MTDNAFLSRVGEAPVPMGEVIIEGDLFHGIVPKGRFAWMSIGGIRQWGSRRTSIATDGTSPRVLIEGRTVLDDGLEGVIGHGIMAGNISP